MEIIIGVHSIIEAMSNCRRNQYKIYCTEKGLNDFIQKTKKANFHNLSIKKIYEISNIISMLKLSEIFKDYMTRNKMAFSNLLIKEELFLVTSKSLELNSDQFIDIINNVKESNKLFSLKIIAIDGVTNINNAAAIFRTAAFFGVDYILIENKSSFIYTPQFYRVSSGSLEHLQIVRVNNLCNLIRKLKEFKIFCIGFTEKAIKVNNFVNLKFIENGVRCLVFGGEELGITNSVRRELLYEVKLENFTSYTTLNVSVASALAMERYFKIY